MKKLKEIDGACVLCALHYVSKIDEDTIIRICTLHGFREGQGMENQGWRSAATQLGLKLRWMMLKPTRLKKFIKDNPVGLFFIGTHDHLFVVDNGIIVDPRCKKPPGFGRIIREAWVVRK